MNDIKKTLRTYGFSEIQIADFFKYYNMAIEKNYPYPEAYAMLQMVV